MVAKKLISVSGGGQGCDGEAVGVKGHVTLFSCFLPDRNMNVEKHLTSCHF